jgi:hypothetical protein
MAGPSRPLRAGISSEAFLPGQPFPVGNSAPDLLPTHLQSRASAPGHGDGTGG